MAEAVCSELLKRRQLLAQWTVDSAGTSAWHIDEQPDSRTIATCIQHQIPIDSQARQIISKDFLRFAHILAMDHENMSNLQRFKQFDKTHVALLGHYDPQGVLEVGDPYYGGDDGFEHIYQHIYRSCEAFLDSLEGDG
jgi:low molecular weight phosphotyrosine protein phosphatase